MFLAGLSIWKPSGNRPNEEPVDMARCRVMVATGYRAPHFHQCYSKKKAVRIIEGVRLGLCATHDPESEYNRKKREHADAQQRAQEDRYDADAAWERLALLALRMGEGRRVPMVDLEEQARKYRAAGGEDPSL